MLLVHLVGQDDQRLAMLANIVNGLWRGCFYVVLAVLDQIRHHHVDHASNHLVDKPPIFKLRIAFLHRIELRPKQGLLMQLLQAQEGPARKPSSTS